MYIFRIAQSFYGLIYLWLYNYLIWQLDENFLSFISIDQYIWQRPFHFLEFSHACFVTQANIVIQAEEYTNMIETGSQQRKYPS